MIIARSVWGAKPASLSGVRMRLPATQVFIHHSVTPVTANLAADVRTIESIGLQRFGQFSYSYVIHPHDGEIFEGSGLMRGAHTAQRNSTSFGIAWAGNYEERAPKVQQIEATRWLIHHLTEQGYLIPGADILPHNAVFNSACPGRNVMKIFNALRVPWEGPMAGDSRPDTIAPIVGGMPAYDENGNIKGYILIGADGGIFPFGEGVANHGSVEHIPPEGRMWLPKA